MTNTVFLSLCTMLHASSWNTPCWRCRGYSFRPCIRHPLQVEFTRSIFNVSKLLMESRHQPFQQVSNLKHVQQQLEANGFHRHGVAINAYQYEIWDIFQLLLQRAKSRYRIERSTTLGFTR
ncbi:hypothetical protein C8Q75DRAFT_571442 [Abortiporus biennis]|nr:hypothetical protein C8Q75DRAFT_571442 [Abortiporus biennis]